MSEPKEAPEEIYLHGTSAGNIIAVWYDEPHTAAWTINHKYIRADKAEQHLEAADKQIGWLKGDKTRLSKSIKIGERAMDSLMAMEEKVSKQLAEAEQQLAEEKTAKMRWEVAAEDYRTKIVPKYKHQLAAKDKEIEALRKAWAIFGTHKKMCDFAPTGMCTCGFEAALKENN